MNKHKLTEALELIKQLEREAENESPELAALIFTARDALEEATDLNDVGFKV